MLLLRCAGSPTALGIFIVCFTPFVFLVTVSLCISSGDFSLTLSASFKHTPVGGDK